MDYSYDTLCSKELEAAIEKTWEKVDSLTAALHRFPQSELEAAIERTWEKVHSLTPALHRFTQSLQSLELYLTAVQQRGCFRVTLLKAERDRLRHSMSL